METHVSQTNSLPPDSVPPNPQEQTPPSPNSMPILDGSSPFSQPEHVDDHALVPTMLETENGPETQDGSSSSPASTPGLAEAEILDGSDDGVLDLVPLMVIENGEDPLSCMETLADQFSDPSLDEDLECELESPSPINAVNLHNYESNSHLESSGPSQWSYSASSSRQPTISADWFVIKESKPSLVGAGLYNLGNTCFINAILQCLTHTVPLVEGLRSSGHPLPSECGSEGFCVLCALREHIDTSITCSGGALSPYKLVDNLNHFSSYFGRRQQEDAHEFLQCFLDKLEKSWSDSEKQNEGSSCKDENLVERVFGGSLISKLRCCNCGHCSDTREPLIDLSLEIEDVDTLPMALESFTKIEKINDLETKFTCEECKQEVAVEKQLVVDEAPPVAAFHLKRFKTDGNFVEKIDKHVDFPLELDLKPYTSDNDRNVELKYELYAIVEHTGFSSTSGHYFCFIRSSPDTWYKLDDSKVTRVREEFVLSQEAYILFYARQGTPWFSSLMKEQMQCSDPPIMNTSPKSVLDNVEKACHSYAAMDVVDGCTPNAPRDVGQKISTFFSRQKPGEVLVADTRDAADGLSEQIDRSKPDAGGFNEFKDSTPMTNASTLVGVSKCFAGTSHNENNKCSTSSPGDNGGPKRFEKVRIADFPPFTPPKSRNLGVFSSEYTPEPKYNIPRDVKSADNVICKRRSKNVDFIDPEDPERKEAVRYLKKAKGIPGDRKSQLLAAVLGSQSEGSLNKKRKRIGIVSM